MNHQTATPPFPEPGSGWELAPERQLSDPGTLLESGSVGALRPFCTRQVLKDAFAPNRSGFAFGA
jgi:hypothetical protein